MATLASNNQVMELSELDQRAIRSFVLWIDAQEKAGTLEVFDYQRETLEKLKDIVGL